MPSVVCTRWWNTQFSQLETLIETPFIFTPIVDSVKCINKNRSADLSFIPYSWPLVTHFFFMRGVPLASDERKQPILVTIRAFFSSLETFYKKSVLCCLWFIFLRFPVFTLPTLHAQVRLLSRLCSSHDLVSWTPCCSPFSHRHWPV